MLKSVLIVDDSGTARLYVRSCFEAIGVVDAVFREAGDGEQALAVLRSEGADLVVTDLVMPRLDGEGLLRQIKADAALEPTPVVVVSSTKNPAIVSRMEALGALAVVAKPLAPARLAQAIDGLAGPKDEDGYDAY